MPEKDEREKGIVRVGPLAKVIQEWGHGRGFVLDNQNPLI
jgi:hypothetical protein